jgi:hypothetical protein
MDLSFQQIVIIVAVILLIVTLTVIGYMMNNIDKLKPWPPSSNQCPDGWTYDTSYNICRSTGTNVGSMITDVSCGLFGSLTMGSSPLNCRTYSDVFTSDTSGCIPGWVQGNASNFRDPSNCYMLANSTSVPTSVKNTNYLNLSYKSSSDMQDNIDWAKAFDISWDGLS